MERAGELLVLRERAGEIRTCLEELVLEQLDLAGGVREPAAEEGDLVLEEADLRLELVDLLLELFLLFAWIELRHLLHLPPVRKHTPGPPRDR